MPDGRDFDEPLLTHGRNFERGKNHVAKGLVSDPLAIEANGVTIRTGLAVREATGLAHSIREWQSRHGSGSSHARLPVVNNARFLVLRDLYFAPDHALSMSQLSDSLNVTMTYVTKLVDDLIGSSWVDRTEDPVDKRRTLARLTPDGFATIEELLPPVARQIEKNWSVLTDDEKRLLIHLLSKVLASVDHAEDAVVRPDLAD